MENKTITQVGDDSSRKDGQPIESDAIKSVDTNSQNASISNIQQRRTTDVINQPSPPKNIDEVREQQKEFETYDPKGSTFYNAALADQDLSSDDVSIAEHWIYTDSEITEHGNF